jgi:hypothetical protein
MTSSAKIPYSFSILRYVHDPVSQEFANVGIALYSSETRYLNARCENHYGRITRMFGKIDGERFKQTMRFIQDRLQRIGNQLPESLAFDGIPTLEKLLAMVLPHDDSAIQFSPAGVGLSSDLDQTLNELFVRFVEKYSVPIETSNRDDSDIWRVYREPLERRHLSSRLTQKKIVAPNFAYEFEHAWKNETWHVYEPISFDLLEANSILDKANRWLGRGTVLADSQDRFKMHILLGEPLDPSLRGAFAKAQNILNRMPKKPELITEGEAESFADEFEARVREHDREE